MATAAQRWPEGVASWALGRSRCDHCRTALAARDLIPLISFFWLRGRCRVCREPIAGALPLSEYLAAMIAALPFLLLPASEAVFVAIAGLLLLWLAWVDYWHWRLPLGLTAIYAALGIAHSFWLAGAPPWADWLFATGIAAIIWSALHLLDRIFQHVRGRPGLGGGDIALLAASAYWLEPSLLAWTVFAAGLAGIVVILCRPRSMWQEPIRFGPILCAALLAVMLLGEMMQGWLQHA